MAKVANGVVAAYQTLSNGEKRNSSSISIIKTWRPAVLKSGERKKRNHQRHQYQRGDEIRK